ncbi:MAG TPA: hypothetical protein PKZ32_09985 [Candidatus Melainabacteria bacterium]|jgi:hypothetical protein|nr:hypothetical protein [Candidatus Melainabacteria bacterium]
MSDDNSEDSGIVPEIDDFGREDCEEAESPESEAVVSSAVAVAERNGKNRNQKRDADKSKGAKTAKGAKRNSAHINDDDSDVESEEGTDKRTKTKKLKINLQWKIPMSFEDLCVVSMGIIIPLSMVLLSAAFAAKRLTLVLLNHPVETSVQLAFALLIPLVNYRLWRSIKRKDFRFSALRGILSGMAIGTALTICAASLGALIVGSEVMESEIGTTFSSGFTFLGSFTFLAMLVALYQINRFRLARDFRASRAQVVMFAFIGVFLSMISLCATEAKSFYVRFAERSAVTNDKAERQRGLRVLRTLDIERQLRMECTDDRAAGLAGLFVPIKSSTQKQLYFAITGKPFRDVNAGELSAMSDDYLRRHVVGEPVKGLTLVRSLLSGSLSPATLTSTVNWTYVFKNDSAGPQEARAEIALPAGTAITGMTLWKDGEPSDARIAVSVSEPGQGEQSWVQADHNCPAMLTPIGHGRFLLHCYPVEQDEELKIRMTMVVPLKAESASQAALPVPRFVAANFTLDEENHLIKIKSPLSLKAHSKGLKQTVSTSGQHIIAGPLTKEELKGNEVGISAQLPAKMEQVAVFDMISTKLKEREEKEKLKKKREQELAAQAQAEAELAEEEAKPQQVVVMIDGSRGVRQQLEDVARVLKPTKAKKKAIQILKKGQVAKRYVVETIRPICVKPPKNLVVVLDGSSALAGQSKEIITALRSVPKGVLTSVMVASEEQKKILEPLEVESGIKVISEMKFAGGQDNLQAVVKASELAGESANGAVLWIHGPQPAFNREIYIMSQYSNVPAFYEYSIDSGETDTLEFFKNHAEIGPFSQIPKSGAMGKDIANFVSRWRSDRTNYAVALAETTEKPTCRMATDKEAMELLALRANAYCEQLLSERRAARAATIAATYGLVTPVSSAIINETSTGRNLQLGEAPSNSSSQMDCEAPTLQGATNGTIGPQGADATYITGINTAGTVRVNNLANLEAILNIVTNLAEIGGLILGFGLLIHGLFQRNVVVYLPGLNASLTHFHRIAYGVAIMFIASSLPAIVNWFVASARDANLFS